MTNPQKAIGLALMAIGLSFSLRYLQGESIDNDPGTEATDQGILSLGSQKSVSQSPNLFARLERSGCFGTCPAYEIEVMTDGKMTYNGRSFVGTLGRADEKLNARQLKQLRDAFERAGFESLREDCCRCYDVTDHPTVWITLATEKTRKQVEDYHGCRDTPPALRALESEFDKIVGSDRWIQRSPKAAK